MLKLSKVTKDYRVGDDFVKALKGLDLEFRKSEFVAILGQSGCGKTTLLNIVGGLDRYTTGDLVINGRSTKEYKDRDWDTYRNHSIGFVFQTYNLIPHLTVLRNVELALTLSGIGFEERKRRATEALQKVGLDDQLSKKPNQLSGGQMQRVAIARAIVNNPDIILADEPTGALDTATSVQVMEILKEIAKDKLVIMVTHNPELAEKYSTRIVRLLDGNLVSDSNPYEDKEVKKEEKQFEKKKEKKTAMSFFTALSLSAKNLLTKKGRTILTAFAGSIGIIGIAMVLALSNGFQTYVDKIQTDTLSTYPLQINESTVDYTTIMTRTAGIDWDEYPGFQKIIVNNIYEKLSNMVINNNLSEEYIEYLNNQSNIDPELYYAIQSNYGINMNIYGKTTYAGMEIPFEMQSGLSMGVTSDSLKTWQQLVENQELLSSQYDIINEGGKWPENKNEIVICVDRYNRVSDMTLAALGIYSLSGENKPTEYTFEDLLELEFRVFTNDQIYVEGEGVFAKKNPMQIADMYEEGLPLRVVGIVRPNEDTSTGFITGTIGYHSDLTDYALESASSSSIVEWIKDANNAGKNPLTGEAYLEYTDASGVIHSSIEQEKSMSKGLGANQSPTSINIYPKDFSSKETIKETLDAYNERDGITEEEKVQYTDVMAIIVSSMNTVIDSISYVLISFTAISLVVSSIMIGIITYVSVIERTKEIGILRSIGARKKDISRVFNAETFIIGLVAGLIGVTFTGLVSIPINMLLYSLTDINGIANLNIVHAIILVIISVCLTLIAGLVPSKVAARKDPVVALRTE